MESVRERPWHRPRKSISSTRHAGRYRRWRCPGRDPPTWPANPVCAIAQCSLADRETAMKAQKLNSRARGLSKANRDQKLFSYGIVFRPTETAGRILTYLLGSQEPTFAPGAHWELVTFPSHVTRFVQILFVVGTLSQKMEFLSSLHLVLMQSAVFVVPRQLSLVLAHHSSSSGLKMPPARLERLASSLARFASEIETCPSTPGKYVHS